MKVAIWDTYVTRADEKQMHFDIIVPEKMNDMQAIIEYGLEYLSTKPFETGGISATECTYCHVEDTNKKAIISNVKIKGYAIKELRNCDYFFTSKKL